MTIGELIADLKEMGQDDEQVIIVLADGVEHLDELEEGSILNIVEAGGWNAMARARTIMVEPR